MAKLVLCCDALLFCKRCEGTDLYENSNKYQVKQRQQRPLWSPLLLHAVINFILQSVITLKQYNEAYVPGFNFLNEHIPAYPQKSFWSPSLCHSD